MDSVLGRFACQRLLAWRRALAILLVALLSPFPALLAFWADASGDGAPDVWADPASGHVFTLVDLDAFSDDIDVDGLKNWQELQLGTNPFLPDTDGDGISDVLDPLPLSAYNLSPINGIAWGAIATEDADVDGMPNFFDPVPFGQGFAQAGSLDSDGDGISDDFDPARWDYSNTSPFNGIDWGIDVIGDEDGDGVPNFYDWYPYDSGRWGPLQDSDSDGIHDVNDPRPSDYFNLSPVNGVNWIYDVYGDSDVDGIPNFYDIYPYNSGTTLISVDSDGDGIPDSLDPSPWDYYNYSSANALNWQWEARGDVDGDGIANFYDQFPYDYHNGSYVPPSDVDGDGIPDSEDPAPCDPSNLSPVNGGLWYSAALADADGDGNPNFTDPWPYDPSNGILPPNWNSWSTDTDGDGIPNILDLALADSTNFSIYNNTSWYGNFLGDIDGDGVSNFHDVYPYDYYNGLYFGPDTDGDGIPDLRDPYPYDPYNFFDADNDGIPDSSDPALSDPNNLSPINGLVWYGDVRGDADGDGILNFWDLAPYGPPQVDSDGDGLIDSIDPAPGDHVNFSPYNMDIWPSDALGDTDGDGTPNFFDAWPYDSRNGVVDADGDGLPDDSDPVPLDPFNYSTHNQMYWVGVDALGDQDNDGVLNFFDGWPNDPYNGSPTTVDSDGDGIPDDTDPSPLDGTNLSTSNGFRWGQDLFGDADGDGIANYWDTSPYGFGDTDGDGIPDGKDPAPNDGKNYSPINLRTWYGYALGDDDHDQIPNLDDPDPNEGLPYEPYYDEQPWASSSPLVLLNDGYDELGDLPAQDVTPPRDFDDETLIIKAGPRSGFMATEGLTKLNLFLPHDYLLAGGSVTIAKEGEGSVRVHAVRKENGNGVEDRIIPFGSSYVPPVDGVWEYWIEGVTEGAVTLRCHFPQKVYGKIDGQHQLGAMPRGLNVPLGLMVCAAHLSVDRDRDGTVSPGSYADTTPPGRPFRFWVNDDDDSGDAGDAGKADIPGAETDWLELDGRDPNYYDDVVNGSRDLVDFCAVYLDINMVAELLPPNEGYKYKLKHADGALNIVYTSLSFDEGSSYLKKPLTTGFGYGLGQSPGAAKTWQVTQEGIELEPDFILVTRYLGEGVILVECRSVTDNPLVLVVEKDGVVLVELSIDLRVSLVEDMYRHVDLTGSAKEYDGGEITPPKAPRKTETDEPIGLPDSESNNKYFVFVHGYNVDAQKARGWNAEVFKRLYAIGSRARFVGVTWNGTPSTLIPGFISQSYPDYYKGVFHAFLTGDAIKTELAKFIPGGSDVTVAAHSLGNMVVSHAIQADEFKPTRYFMINAAVPLEAYDLENVGSLERASMIEDDWKSRPARLYASNWHELFSGTPSDHRNELSWKNRFNKVRDQTSVYNFYSPGEDVLGDTATDTAAVLVTIWNQGFDFDRGAWKSQELLKGVDWTTSLGNLVMERNQAGWNSEQGDYLLIPSSSITDSQLRLRPFFHDFLEHELMSNNASVASAKAAEPKVQYDLLARGIPALSHAAGANVIKVFGGANFNMELLGRAPEVWPVDGHAGLRSGRWIHSDFKNVALPYVAKAYQAMIDRGNLNTSL